MMMVAARRSRGESQADPQPCSYCHKVSEAVWGPAALHCTAVARELAPLSQRDTVGTHSEVWNALDAKPGRQRPLTWQVDWHSPWSNAVADKTPPLRRQVAVVARWRAIAGRMLRRILRGAIGAASKRGGCDAAFRVVMRFPNDQNECSK